MEACLAVEKEVDRVLLKFGGINEHADRILTDLLTYIESLKNELENGNNIKQRETSQHQQDKEEFIGHLITAPPDHVLTTGQVVLLNQAMKKVKETVQRLATDHRDLHSTVSKVGKAIDRNFVSDFASTSREDVFSSSEKIQLLNHVICQHFYRQGLKDVADEIAAEAGITVDDTGKEPFMELNYILDCLKEHDLEPALAWATIHHDNLVAQGSSLEFKLHRLRFIDLMKKGLASQNEAINYARLHFHKFVQSHEKDIQTLMGMFLFVPNGIYNSPYNTLLESELWIEIYDVFLKDACNLLGLSVDSPLSICVNAGCAALPALLNIKQVMLQRQVTGIWNGKDELPIEIDLGQESRYHSMFACPILRQQSTENNPPMRLVCGHVISRDALNKLCSGNKLKCPYCPMEQSPADARLIIF